jgi:hypothetical protein
MKKAFLAAVASFTMVASLYAGQSQQSISYTGPQNWVPGTQVTLDVSLTFAGYSAFSFSHWLNVSSQISPFLSVVSVMYFTPFGQGSPGPWTLNSNFGSGTDAPAPPGTYHTTSITFALAAGAPLGSYMISTSTTNPRASIISDTKFNDHAIPTATFNFDVVPEPGTVALLGIGIVSMCLLVNARWRRSGSERN